MISIFRSKLDVPTLPAVDLITTRPGSSEEEVTDQDLFNCQIIWDFTHIYRLVPSRRKELCSLLTKLAKRVPELKNSDSLNLWSRVASNPDWPDEIMSDEENY